MSFNLLDLVKDQLGSEFAKHASSAIGASEGATSKAMDALIPSILGSVADLGSSKSGVEKILDSVGGLDTGLLGNIGGALTGGSNMIGKLSNLGGPILSLLLGNKSAALGSLIANFAGLKSGAGSTLLKLAAPFIMNVIGGKIKGMGVGAIMDLFTSQKSNINAGLPGGFDLGSLGLSANNDNILDKASDMVESAANKAVDTAGDVADVAVDAGKKGMSFLRWLLPLFLLLMVLAYFFGIRTGCGAIDSTVDKANDLTENVVETGASAAGDLAEGAVDLAKGAVSLTGDALSSVFSAVDEAAKAALDGIKFVAGSAGDQIKNFIEGGFSGDNRFTFKNLTFASGSSQIDGESGIEVDNVGAILKAYPNVNIAIEGYTDNTGDAAGNVTLSQERAASVKARLVDMGVSGDRIATAGYGSSNPVADNATPEGRRQNRRIEIRIVE